MRRLSGFTLIELLVTVSLCSLLMAIAIPAIQSARESARGAQCRSRFHELGVALHSYVDTSGGWIPPGLRPVRLGRTQLRRLTHQCSIQAQLLPYLEHDVDWARFSTSGFEGIDTAALGQISSLVCPSDRLAKGAVNYRVCSGTFPGGSQELTGGHSNARRRGIARVLGMRVSRVTDGLSNTAFFSERVQGDREDGEFDAWRDRVFVDWRTDLSPDELARVCASASDTFPHYSSDGTNWSVSDDTQTLYTHVLTPNSPIIDCTAAGSEVASARSWHPGSVGMLAGDGSVRAVSSEIDLSVWRAWATPDGNDVAQ